MLPSYRKMHIFYGSVVDIRFDTYLPPIYSLLHANEGRVSIEVLTQLDEHRDVLLIDNIFRFIQAGSEVSGLMGQMPSRLGYQPTMVTELSQLEERIAMLGLEQLSPENRKVIARARRLERFLTHPFFTMEQFTGQKGKLVNIADALNGCERILADEFNDYPESALYMIGAIDEAKVKTKKQPGVEHGTAE